MIAAKSPNLAPVVPWPGSTIQLDGSSHYDLPGFRNIRAGGPALTINNLVHSLAPSATTIIRNGRTFPLAPVATPAPSPRQTPLFVIAGSTDVADSTADAASRYIISGQTLTLDDVITAASTPIYLDPGASVLVIGSSSVTLSNPASAQTTTQLTYAGSTYTANPFGDFVIAGQT